MTVWQIRLLGIVVALGTAYLAYADAHQALVVLLCSGAAALVAIISVILLWRRPRLATTLAALSSIAAIVGQTVVIPRASHAGGAFSQSTILLSQSGPAPGAGGFGDASNAARPGVSPTPVVFADDVADNVKAAVSAGDSSLQGLFNLAAAQVADDIYPGALRGASGTLAAGSGNSVDKALLLRDLLRTADPNADLRFAWCTLRDADAATFASAVLSKPDARPAIMLERAASLASATTDPETRSGLEHWAMTWQRLTDIAKAETTALAGELPGAAAGATGSDGASKNTASNAAWESAAVRNHVWLERRDGGDWVDLDPTLGSDGFGRARCKPDQTSASLPENLYARIVVRLRVEERDAGALNSHDALAESLRVADLGGRNLSFFFAEPLGLDATGSATPQPAASGDLDDANSIGPVSFTPLLIAGSQRAAGKTFTLPAVPIEKALPDQVLSGTAGARGAFETAATPAPTPVPVQTANGPEVTGVWLRIEPSTLDGSGDPVVETLYDRIGFVARVANGSTTSPSAPSDGSDRYELSRLWNIAVWTGAQGAGVGDPTGEAQPAGDQTLDVTKGALGLMQSRFMALRTALYEAATGPAARYAVPGPSVSLIAMGEPSPDGLSDIGVATDIATDRTQPLFAGSQMPPAAAAAWAVASVLAERLIAHGGRELERTAQPAAALDGRDAIAAFAAARADNVRVQMLAPADLGRVAMLDEPAEARARISEQLRAGRSVIVPVKTAGNAPYGWWIFNPNDGSVRDQMSDGRHTELEEESFLQRTAARVTRFWRRVGPRVCFAGAMAAASLTLASHNADSAGQIVKVVSSIGKGQDDQRKKIAQAACKTAGGAASGDP